MYIFFKKIQVSTLQVQPQPFAPPLPRPLGERITPYLHQCRLYRVTYLPHIDINWSLVTSLVEQWQPDTYIFHLPTCEMSITLQDCLLMAMQCVGPPI